MPSILNKDSSIANFEDAADLQMKNNRSSQYIESELSVN